MRSMVKVFTGGRFIDRVAIPLLSSTSIVVSFEFAPFDRDLRDCHPLRIGLILLTPSTSLLRNILQRLWIWSSNHALSGRQEFKQINLFIIY